MSSGLFHKLTLSNLIYTLKIIWILVWRKQGYVQDIMAAIACVHEQILSQWLLIKCREKNHRLVVLNDENKVAGILTTMDVMCYLQKRLIA